MLSTITEVIPPTFPWADIELLFGECNADGSRRCLVRSNDVNHFTCLGISNTYAFVRNTHQELLTSLDFLVKFFLLSKKAIHLWVFANCEVVLNSYFRYSNNGTMIHRHLLIVLRW